MNGRSPQTAVDDHRGSLFGVSTLRLVAQALLLAAVASGSVLQAESVSIPEVRPMTSPSAAQAVKDAALKEMRVTMNAITATGVQQEVGTVTLQTSAYGLVLTPNLRGLPTGAHGFHVHENPTCDAKAKDGEPNAGGAAGKHLDPGKTGRHGYPWGDGHLGDLPVLHVDQSGSATQPVLAPRLTMADVMNRALMVHAGPDNHADEPTIAGGGGDRLFCGVIR